MSLETEARLATEALRAGEYGIHPSSLSLAARIEEKKILLMPAEVKALIEAVRRERAEQRMLHETGRLLEAYDRAVSTCICGGPKLSPFCKARIHPPLNGSPCPSGDPNCPCKDPDNPDGWMHWREAR